MNKKQIAITLGIMCILLTSGIIIQINTIKKNSISNNIRTSNNDLRDEVLKYKEKYEKTYAELEESENRLEKARQEASKNNNSFAEMEQELKSMNSLLGLTDLTGEGIIITVADNENASIKDEDLSNELVHNTDIIELVNELKNTGAEAISVNGQRVVSTTSINCVGAVITVNGEKVNSPFTILAIGNRERLNGITRPGSYIELMEEAGIVIKVEKSEEVTIPKYNKVINAKYMSIKN